jgi:GrpB-like predicted nucleotidyltransferase (UPF0157 family)
MTIERQVTVVPYDARWPEIFKREAAIIREALGENCLDIYHIGSTAVPGLAAKPIVDIMPVVKDINKVCEIPQYIAMGEYGIVGRRYFYKEENKLRKVHIHIFQDSSPEIIKHLRFRDWMRNNGDDLEKYANLKILLADKFPNDIDKYCSGKKDFITSIYEKCLIDL